MVATLYFAIQPQLPNASGIRLNGKLPWIVPSPPEFNQTSYEVPAEQPDIALYRDGDHQLIGLRGHGGEVTAVESPDIVSIGQVELRPSACSTGHWHGIRWLGRNAAAIGHAIGGNGADVIHGIDGDLRFAGAGQC